MHEAVAQRGQRSDRRAELLSLLTCMAASEDVWTSLSRSIGRRSAIEGRAAATLCAAVALVDEVTAPCVLGALAKGRRWAPLGAAATDRATGRRDTCR